MSCPESKDPSTSIDAGKHTDDEDDNAVTLVEILEEEAQLEEDANAVLGGSDDANCTYRLVISPQFFINVIYLTNTIYCFRVMSIVKPFMLVLRVDRNLEIIN
jgi:hypothetical protein